MNAAKQTEKQFFTVEEANRRLPLVKAIVKDIVRLYAEIDDRQQRLARIRDASAGMNRREDTLYSEELDHIELELEKDRAQLREYVEELLELGVELKDCTLGLIDFPTIVDGREAYLCWKLGEEEVAFWHELDAGFQGRQSLLEGSVFTDGVDDEKQDQ